MSALFSYTDVEENEAEKVSLYPNPANDIIHIEGLEGASEVLIYNTYGVRVKAMSLGGDGDINVSDLAAGLYLLRVNGHTMRFVKD